MELWLFTSNNFATDEKSTCNCYENPINRKNKIVFQVNVPNGQYSFTALSAMVCIYKHTQCQPATDERFRIGLHLSA